MLHDEAAVDVLLAELQVGIVDDGAFGLFAGEPDPYRVAGSVAKPMQFAIRIDDLQRAALHRAAKEFFDSAIHG